MYLHKNHVIHRDLKLGNIFLDDQMQVKLGDFGLCAELKSRGQRRFSVLGTPNYIAPEVLDAQRFNGHSFQVDIWGLGIIIYILLFGKPPFDSPEVKQTYGKIRINDFSFPKDIKVNPGAKDLINLMLVTNPE